MTEQILKAINQEISRLQQARKILAAGKVSRTQTAPAAAGKTPTTRRRRLSAKARRAIAEAQRRRWARVRGEQKSALGKAAEKKEAAKS